MTRCFICNTDYTFYFTKQFNEFGLDTVDYYRCPNCGFVLSKTHAEMEASQWERINIEFHRKLENFEYSTGACGSQQLNQPPYLQQAVMLNTLHKNDLIDISDCVDWGSGIGHLSNVLAKYFNIPIKNYDKYMTPHRQYLAEDEMAGRRFSTVINSAVFEHVTNRGILDEINALVSDTGCLIFHTVVCEEIPCDPNWFYLAPPVHCAFHTNKSMAILMNQWGYSCSIYCPAAKMWTLFKDKPKGIESIVGAINLEFQTDYLYFKDGFMDYWK